MIKLQENVIVVIVKTRIKHADDQDQLACRIRLLLDQDRWKIHAVIWQKFTGEKSTL